MIKKESVDLQQDPWSGSTNTKGTTVVIDGDWLAFVGACLTHVKHYIIIDLPTGTELKAVTTERALTNCLTSLGRSRDDDSIEIRQEKRIIDNWEVTAKSVMIAKANKLKRETGARRIKIVIGRKK